MDAYRYTVARSPNLYIISAILTAEYTFFLK